MILHASDGLLYKYLIRTAIMLFADFKGGGPCKFLTYPLAIGYDIVNAQLQFLQLERFGDIFICTSFIS